MKIDDFKCDVCDNVRNGAAGWWQVDMTNGDWKMGPFQVEASGVALGKHLCPKVSCATTLLQQWMEKHHGDGGRA